MTGSTVWMRSSASAELEQTHLASRGRAHSDRPAGSVVTKAAQQPLATWTYKKSHRSVHQTMEVTQ